MSWAPIVAAVAGVCLAAAMVELVAAGVPRPRRGIGLAVLQMAPRPGAPKGLVARVEASGVGLGVGEVMAAKLAGAIVAGGGALAVTTSTAALVAAPLAGWFAPDLVLRSRARGRARAIEAELADVLDLLRVAVGAGLTPWRALDEVGRRHPGVLAAELGATARRIALGVPGAEALDRLERCAPGAGVHTLAQTLRRVDRLGAAPGRALTALAEEARARQARRLAEQAARAAPKIQLVVAHLLVPDVLQLVAAALIPSLTGASL
ncbi:MAG: type II secretion system F family protein [Solirubrobacteraceae bacterium]